MLAVDAVSYRYPDGRLALDGVSLSIAPGEKLVVLGANGAGKSTFLSLLNGLLPPSGGRLLLRGAPVSVSRKGLLALRSTVGLVMQDPDDQLFAATVFEDVSFGPLNQGLAPAAAEARVHAALATMGIAPLAGTPTHLLSFGQRKRVAIAGVLAMRPSVVLFDEPTAGLDPAGIDDFAATLEALSAEGTTLVIATHDLDFALRFASRAAIFAEGRLRAAGPAATLFADRGLLEAAGLRQPVTVRLWTALAARGLVSGPLPEGLDAETLAALLAAGR